MFVPQFRTLFLSTCLLAFVTAPAVVEAEDAGSETDSAPDSAGESHWSLSRILDQMPVYLADRLPGLDPDGAIRVFIQPHVGDFFHGDYIRTPFGIRAKVTDHIELNAELGSYIARSSGNGSGLSGMNLGLKCEDVLRSMSQGGVSVGANYRVPFSGSPIEFSDGFRHFQPYVAATRPILPKWQLLGFASLGANFLERTSLPANYGRNELHTDSLNVSMGIARAFGRIYVSLTTRIASSALTSNVRRQNFTLKPDVVVPLRRDPNARTQVYLALGAHSVWGPGGRETGTSTGLRLSFHLDRHRAVNQPSLADMFAR